MANIFGVGGPLGPVAPGLSGALNPLMFLGSGMATGNMAGAMGRMANIQQNAQQLSLQRRHLAQDIAAQRAANIIAQQKLAHQMSKPTGTSLQQNLNWAMGLPEGDPRRVAALEAIRRGGGTTVNVGGAGEFGAVPQAMARVEDPDSPTGSRLVEEPGAPAATKREIEKAKRIAGLDRLEDSLKRYRSTLRTYGPEIMAGEGKLRLASTYGDLTMRRKEADELGALTGPDLELLEAAMVNPTSLTAQYYEKTGRTEALFSQLDQAQRAIDDARARVEGREPARKKATYTRDRPAIVADDDDFDALAEGDHYVGPDGVPRVK